MLNEVKHLAIAREILRCDQNDTVHHLTCDRVLLTNHQLTNHISCPAFLQEVIS